MRSMRSSAVNPVISLWSYWRCLHGSKITECIEYKLLLLTYKFLTATQLWYLHNLISVQPPHSTRSLSLVALARPPTSSSLHITARSFLSIRLTLSLESTDYTSLRQPHPSLSISDLSFLLLPHLLPVLTHHSLTIHNPFTLSFPA